MARKQPTNSTTRFVRSYLTYLGVVTIAMVATIALVGSAINAWSQLDASDYSLRCILDTGVVVFHSDHEWQVTDRGYSSHNADGAEGDLWIKDTSYCERRTLTAEDLAAMDAQNKAIQELIEGLPESNAAPTVPGGDIDPNLWLRQGSEPRVAKETD